MTTICVRELQLVLVFPAIGCESGLSFLNQSQGEVMQKNQNQSKHVLLWFSSENGFNLITHISGPSDLTFDELQNV